VIDARHYMLETAIQTVGLMQSDENVAGMQSSEFLEAFEFLETSRLSAIVIHGERWTRIVKHAEASI